MGGGERPRALGVRRDDAPALVRAELARARWLTNRAPRTHITENPNDIQTPIDAAPATPQYRGDGDLLDAYSLAVSAVAETVGPAVVRIDTRETAGKPGRGGVGSGVVISPDGLVLTNAHVATAPRKSGCPTPRAGRPSSRLLGIDPDTDLALLRADAARSLAFAPLGDSTPPRPDRHRERQSARLRIDRHRGRDFRARPLAALHLGPHDRGHDPDRRGAQPRQFRRPAGVLAW